MKSILKKKLNKKGFTLAELLVVVAIIAVLVAIAIPVFTAATDKAEEAVKKANCRSVLAEATVDYLYDMKLDTTKYTYDSVEYTASVSDNVIIVSGGGYTCNTNNPTPTTE